MWCCKFTNLQAKNIGRTWSMFWACSFYGKFMNNLMSYCGLIDAKSFWQRFTCKTYLCILAGYIFSCLYQFPQHLYSNLPPFCNCSKKVSLQYSQRSLKLDILGRNSLQLTMCRSRIIIANSPQCRCCKSATLIRKLVLTFAYLETT